MPYLRIIPRMRIGQLVCFAECRTGYQCEAKRDKSSQSESQVKQISFTLTDLTPSPVGLIVGIEPTTPQLYARYSSQLYLKHCYLFATSLKG